MNNWEELASKFLRELAKRDMKAWRAHQSREECAQIEVEQRDSAGPPASRSGRNELHSPYSYGANVA